MRRLLETMFRGGSFRAATRLGKTLLGTAALASTTLAAAPPVPATPRPVDASLSRLGRILGVGWGDGYHRCAHRDHRLRDDLPPRSFSATQPDGGHRRWGGGPVMAIDPAAVWAAQAAANTPGPRYPLAPPAYMEDGASPFPPGSLQFPPLRELQEPSQFEREEPASPGEPEDSPPQPAEEDAPSASDRTSRTKPGASLHRPPGIDEPAGTGSALLEPPRSVPSAAAPPTPVRLPAVADEPSVPEGDEEEDDDWLVPPSSR